MSQRDHDRLDGLFDDTADRMPSGMTEARLSDLEDRILKAAAHLPQKSLAKPAAGRGWFRSRWAWVLAPQFAAALLGLVVGFVNGAPSLQTTPGDVEPDDIGYDVVAGYVFGPEVDASLFPQIAPASQPLVDTDQLQLKRERP
ncbi:MAG: hypothetical protein AAGF15_09330 [Pseudomonadota bacterium]